VIGFALTAAECAAVVGTPRCWDDDGALNVTKEFFVIGIMARLRP